MNKPKRKKPRIKPLQRQFHRDNNDLENLGMMTIKDADDQGSQKEFVEAAKKL